jgi:hypothetical protein
MKVPGRDLFDIFCSVRLKTRTLSDAHLIALLPRRQSSREFGEV